MRAHDTIILVGYSYRIFCQSTVCVWSVAPRSGVKLRPLQPSPGHFVGALNFPSSILTTKENVQVLHVNSILVTMGLMEDTLTTVPRTDIKWPITKRACQTSNG
jgi:hypothetical protein